MGQKDTKILTENKKIGFDYEILEKYQAGIVLNGQEVKSAKLGRINLNSAFVVLKNEEPFLIGCNIPPYQPKNVYGVYSSERPRKLLLRKDEIKELIGRQKQKGLTFKPILVYTLKGKVKIEFALVKNKKKADKRDKIKKKTIDWEIKQALRR